MSEHVDRTAQAYLNNFLKIRDREAVRDNDPLIPGDTDIVRLADGTEVENVIISRHKEPRFYGGTLGRGDKQRAVWVSSMEQARSVSGDRLDLYEAKLGEELIPLWPYAR
jgi:hypothetical protein